MSRFVSWLDETLEPVKNYIVDNHNNPVFWIIVFFAAVIISKLVYSELNKN